jgi:hypothetical protein
MPAMARLKNRTDRHTQKTVSFRLPESLMEQLRALADQNRRTLSGEVRVALESHLATSGLEPAANGPTDVEPKRGRPSAGKSI